MVKELEWDGARISEPHAGFLRKLGGLDPSPGCCRKPNLMPWVLPTPGGTAGHLAVATHNVEAALTLSALCRSSLGVTVAPSHQEGGPHGAREVAQWCRLCLAGVRPWVQSQHREEIHLLFAGHLDFAGQRWVGFSREQGKVLFCSQLLPFLWCTPCTENAPDQEGPLGFILEVEIAAIQR